MPDYFIRKLHQERICVTIFDWTRAVDLNFSNHLKSKPYIIEDQRNYILEMGLLEQSIRKMEKFGCEQT